jgi:hypothetical protein
MPQADPRVFDGDTYGDDVVFSLFDSDYHLGLGALVNSLFKFGFRGTVYAAYRGSLPPWATEARAGTDFREFEVGDGCVIRFVKVDFAGHLTNYKPAFMLSVLRTHASGARRVYYFDVDIVVKAPWRFFQDWVSCGIAVCRDLNEPYMSKNHPLRKYWRTSARELGLDCHQVEGYFNSGFLGLSSEHIAFLEIWQSLMHTLECSGVSLKHFVQGHRPSPTSHMDQDMLNAALMASEFPISPVENSAMDFTPGGYIMSHALALWVKPWRRRYLLDALRGYPPNQAHRLYWRHVSEPIPVMSERRRLAARLSLAIAGVIGRFYGRHW